MAEPVCAVHVASRGPRFFRTGEAVMFEITLDSRSKIGPRPMRDEDRRQYPTAWKAFETGEVSAAEPLTPLIEAVDIPGAKAAQDAQKAERQRRMDARRGGGL